MLLKSATLGAFAIAALVLAGPASAFQVQDAPVNADGSQRFVDPDQQLDRLSEERQDSYDNSANWSGRGEERQSFGASTRDDRSYWGSSMIESPERQLDSRD